MTLHWYRCTGCQQERLYLNWEGQCELCVTMRVMEPVIAALNAGMDKTNNKARSK